VTARGGVVRELRALAGEASALGLSELAKLASTGEAFARTAPAATEDQGSLPRLWRRWLDRPRRSPFPPR